MTERFIFGFENGEFDLFELKPTPHDPEMPLKVFHIETEKTKEHENQLTSMDYHKKLHLIVTSCASGIIKLWSSYKHLLKEIQFKNKIDAVTFLNEQGDLLIAHDKRVSVIKYENY